MLMCCEFHEMQLVTVSEIVDKSINFSKFNSFIIFTPVEALCCCACADQVPSLLQGNSNRLRKSCETKLCTTIRRYLMSRESQSFLLQLLQ